MGHYLASGAINQPWPAYLAKHGCVLCITLNSSHSANLFNIVHIVTEKPDILVYTTYPCSWCIPSVTWPLCKPQPLETEWPSQDTVSHPKQWSCKTYGYGSKPMASLGFPVSKPEVVVWHVQLAGLRFHSFHVFPFFSKTLQSNMKPNT